MISGIDVSHHQGAIDMAAVRKSGRDFVPMKATEGVGYIDPNMAGYRHDAHAAGLIVGLYHFARAGDPVVEASHFLATIGGLAVGEFLVLDWEVPAADPVSWCKAWLDAVHAATGVRPLIYLNQSTRDGHDWSPVIAAGHGLWLAKYDGSTAAVGAGKWPALAMKQYSDKGTVPGIAGAVDLDVFYGDRAALLRYGKQGSAPAPTPAPPTPAAFDVRAWRAHQGDTGAIFQRLQQWLNATYPAYSKIAPTAPSYGPQTARVLAEFCHRLGIASDGKDIGPKTSAALYVQGFRG